MEMIDKRYFIENDNVFEETTYETFSNKILIGSPNKTETNRIDDNTVEDIAYLFDLQLGDYVENTAIPRVTRNEPLPPVPESMEQQLAQLKQDNSNLKSQNAEIILAMVTNNLM